MVLGGGLWCNPPPSSGIMLGSWCWVGRSGSSKTVTDVDYSTSQHVCRLGSPRPFFVVDQDGLERSWEQCETKKILE